MASVEIEHYTKKTAYDEYDIGRIRYITIKSRGMTFKLGEYCWQSTSITYSKWLSLLNPGTVLNFGCFYGSHVDNGIVSIKHTGEGNLKFYVDGARGGTLSCEIPVLEMESVIKKIAEEFIEGNY